MRAGLSTIQQTLTPEAANVLNLSIAEAGKRNHGQTTPLHVAATLLASPSGYLRQACMRSHPNSSHPLQCRALDLCFSVALDRLPSNQNLNSSSGEPPISNALMAALKRAQAHQRRGCPEQQQQPLLAVKVELEQLIVSILDDPGVSRVMREASFSSPSVKATIEQSLNQVNPVAAMPAVGSGFRNLPNRSLYMNPRLQPGNSTVSNSNSNLNPSLNFKPNPNLNVNLDQFGQRRREEVRKVIEILLRDKKKNPVLVGELEPELVVKELLSKIQKMELAEPSLRNVQIISLEKEIGSDRTQILMKMKELGGLIESKIGSNAGGVILDVGDLKWLVEQPGGFAGMVSAQQGLSEVGRGTVAEMGKILARFADGRLWLVGTATCETYLRCQVYHPSMENDWDLQAVPIAAKVPLPGLFQRMGGNGILGSSVESGTPLKGFPAMNSFFSRRPSENIDPGHKTKCCALCTQSYEQELAKLVAKDSEKSSESKPEATRQSLPQWLQNAKLNNGNTNVKTIDQSQTKEQEVVIKTKTEELQRKWNDTCLRLHPSFHHNVSTERLSPATLSMASLYNARPLGRQSFQPKLQLTRNLSLGVSLQLNQSPMPQPTAERVVTPPGSPVKTDLVLGSPKITEVTQKEQPLIELIPSEPLERLSESNREKLANILDPDSFKSLFKALTEKVSWQKEAASVVAANVIQGRLGNNRRKGFGRKDDTWLLFAGPDRVGKKKMAMALSELVCRTVPVIIKLGRRGGSDDDDDAEAAFRGKTILDRIVEAVQRNPSAVIMLEDIDQADMLVYPSIKRAIERGRLPDSYGREINLNNVVFILTTSGVPENLQGLSNSTSVQEEKLADLASSGWNLQLSVGGKNVKRRADWPLEDENTATKSRTEDGSGFSFDLNEAATVEEDTAEGSRNSSDLTVELDNEHNLINKQFQSVATAVSREIFSGVDETIVFKAVDFEAVQSKVASTIVSKFSAIIKDGKHIEVNSEALEHIAGGVWFGEVEVEEWAEKVLVPSFLTLSNTLKSTENDNTNSVVKLVAVKDSERRRDGGDWLPSKVTLVDIER